MTSTPRKILPAYIQNTGNSSIRLYQARAAAQVYSTARNVLPSWTASYFLPEPESPTSLSSSTQDLSTAPPAAPIDHSLEDRFVAFDVLRGRDVLVKADSSGFTIFNVSDRAGELVELCAYTCDKEAICIKIIPSLDAESPLQAVILTKTGDLETTLSIVSLSTSLTTEHSIVLPKAVILSSLITSQHYVAIATPKSVFIYSLTLSVISNLPLPFPVITGASRWLIYPVTRTNPSLPRTPILDTPPETHFVERFTRGLTKDFVSWGREAGEKIGEAISSYLNGPTTSDKKEIMPQPLVTTSSARTTLVVYDVPKKHVLTQFQVPLKLGVVAVSDSGTMVFCSSPKGDEFFVYSLNQVPEAIHLIATFSRGYTYSRVIEVIWRFDNGCIGVISARGTAHIFSLKCRGRETARAVGKCKVDGGVKGLMFVRRQSTTRRRSSTTKDEIPDILTVANTHQRVTSWKLTPATKSRISLLTSYFNPPSTEEQQSIPLARPIADYILPSTHEDLAFPSLTSSPIIKAAFTNQRDAIDCTAKAEVECSVSTRGVTGIRGIRLFGYTLSIPAHTDFGSPIPWTRNEIDLGMPRGEVRYFGMEGLSSSSSKVLETPPSSEKDSPDFQPENGKKKRRNPRGTKDSEIERAISASLGTELDKTRIVTIPPTPPGSFSTPKLQSSEWVGDILDRGKTIVQNVGRRSSPARSEDVCFEEGMEILSLSDAPAIDSLSLDRSISAESDESGHRKVRDEGSVIGEMG